MHTHTRTQAHTHARTHTHVHSVHDHTPSLALSHTHTHFRDISSPAAATVSTLKDDTATLISFPCGSFPFTSLEPDLMVDLDVDLHKARQAIFHLRMDTVHCLTDTILSCFW